MMMRRKKKRKRRIKGEKEGGGDGHGKRKKKKEEKERSCLYLQLILWITGGINDFKAIFRVSTFFVDTFKIFQYFKTGDKISDHVLSANTTVSQGNLCGRL